MREISRRIKVLEQHTPTQKGEVIFFNLIDITEQELSEKIEEIKRNNPKAVIIIDDISQEENN